MRPPTSRTSILLLASSLLAVTLAHPPALVAGDNTVQVFDFLVRIAVIVECDDKTLNFILPPIILAKNDGSFATIVVPQGGPAQLKRVRPNSDDPRQRFDEIYAELCEDSRRGQASEEPESHQLGSETVALAWGHFDNDATYDLAFANRSSHNVSVLLGIAGGDFTADDPSFTDAVHYSTDSWPFALESGDFDGDGYDDLLTVNSGDFVTGSFSLLLSNGNGTFQTPITIDTVERPLDLVVADFDEDDEIDVVTVDGKTQNQLFLLLGDGEGDFAAPTPISLSGAFASTLAVGDLDEDGDLDIITNSGVLFGNGDGTFDPHSAHDPPRSMSKLEVADVDGDGHQDVVGLSSVSGTVHVLRGDGNGNLTAAGRYVTGSFPEHVSIVDIDFDGHLDLLVSNYSSSHATVLYGIGEGLFEATPVYSADEQSSSGGTESVTAAHLDSDGRLDLVVARSNGRGAVLPGLGGDRFGAPIPLHPMAGWRVAAGDVDADGLDDLVFGTSGGAVDLYYWKRTGDHDFETPVGINLPSASARVGGLSLGRFRPEAVRGSSVGLDLMVADTGSEQMLRLVDNGAGSFVTDTTLPIGGAPGGFAVGDLNHDDRPDLVVANQGSITNLDGDLQVYLQAANGSYGAPQVLFDGTTPNDVAIGHVDSDGHPDLIVTLEYSLFSWGMRVLYGNGSGGFGAPQVVTLPAGLFQLVGTVAVDLNDDGFLDIGTRSGNELLMLAGRGDRTFEAAQSFDIGESQTVTTADVDEDGAPDLLSGIFSGGAAVAVLRNLVFDVMRDDFEGGSFSRWTSTVP